MSDDEDYSDEDFSFNEIPGGKSTNYMESDNEDVVESDIELEGETVEPENDSPQKVPLHFKSNSYNSKMGKQDIL